jgi:DNA topoisomerase III
VKIERANLGPCPVCGRDIIENRKGYSCWSREDPGCGFVIWKNKAGKTLPPQVVKELIESLRESRERGEDPGVGRTKAQVTGFRGRSGRTFRAKLKLEQNEEGKWRVEFDEEWAQEPRPTPPDDDGGAQPAVPGDGAAPAEGTAPGAAPEKVTAGAVASDRGS